MTRPLPYLWRMLGFLAVALAIAAVLAPTLARAFAANPLLNGLILAVLLGGVAWNILQVLRLREEVEWVEAFRHARRGEGGGTGQRLMAPLTALRAARRSGRFVLP
ncbi:MAG: flagellar motor protein MotA, partial [Roseococcus sp.]